MRSHTHLPQQKDRVPNLYVLRRLLVCVPLPKDITVTVLAGLCLLYGIPVILVTPVWWGVARLNKDWEARAFMDSIRPAPLDVYHSERLLRITRNRT